MGLRVHVRQELPGKALCMKGKELAGNAWGLGFTFARDFMATLWRIAFEFLEGSRHP